MFAAFIIDVLTRVIAVALALSLAACGGGADANTENGGATEPGPLQVGDENVVIVKRDSIGGQRAGRCTAVGGEGGGKSVERHET